MAEPDALLNGLLPGDPDRAALISSSTRISRGQLDAEVALLSAALASELCTGDVLAIWLPNGPAILALYLACFRTGIVPMPLQPGLKLPELLATCSRAGAEGLVTTPAAWQDHGTELLGLARRVWTCTQGSKLQRVGGNSAPGPERPAGQPSSDPHRLALVLHTSGSSGQPKGVKLSYANLHHILSYRLEHCGLASDSVSVVASCTAQTVGLYQSLALLAAGATLVLLESYEIEGLCEAVNQHRPTHLIMVVSAWDALLHHPTISAHSLSRLCFAAAGADRLRPRIQQRFRDLTGQSLRQSYGLTESSWALINDGARIDKCLALGRPCPGVQVRLQDLHGVPVGAGAVGEIQIRSPRTMLGYLNDAAGTERTIADGWLRTGDLAYQDQDGDYWFAGRSKDLIVLASGDNVSPAEIEGVLCSHPAVSACMVVSHTAPDGSEVPWAFVVPAGDTTPHALQDFLRERLSDYKLPHGIELVSQLPLGLSGKIQRRIGPAPTL